MKAFLITILSLWVSILQAQKRPIDSIAYKTWPSLGYPTLSGDGKYVFYDILNVPAGGITLILQKTDGTWKKEFIGGLSAARFSKDDQQLLFERGADSTGIFTMENKELKYVPNDGSNMVNNGNRWNIYFSKKEPGKLILRDHSTNKESFFLNVIHAKMLERQERLLLCVTEDSEAKSLLWVEMRSGRVSKVWQGEEFKSLILDEAHAQLAFRDKDSIWYYKFGAARAMCLANEKTGRTQAGLPLSDIDHFSKDGERLFLRFKAEERSDSEKPLAEVWSYMDVKLKSEFYAGQREYLGVLDLKSKRIYRLQYRNDQLLFPTNRGASDTLILVQNSLNSSESWNVKSKVSWSLVSSRTGLRRTLDFLNNKRIVIFSPTGKYLIYNGYGNRGYCSYKINSGVISDLTKDLPVVWADRYRDDLLADRLSNYPREMSGLVWLKADKGFLAFDRYDIWKIDPDNKRKPVNLTNGYGKRHQIVFSLALRDYREYGVDNNDKLYLSAFNLNTKDNGFYLSNLSGTADPEKLIMGPYIFNVKSGYLYSPAGADFEPIKSRKDHMYIVRRMNVQQAPNYFSTRDFRTFIPLSNLRPEKKFNWYTTQLHTWKSFNGNSLQGILYKPENFDPNKSYPVIFYYYERKADGLNAYIKPEPLCDGCVIDIPTYLSKGYLVFSPDVIYDIGNPMQGTYDAVVSAARYIASLPYVNGNRMGIQGCSFGGLQTNYLVTHTNFFKAAVSASGIADLVSHYGSLNGGDGAAMNSYYESGQARMGGSLWEKPQSYINNSPIFQVNRVNTPLLIMHTKRDDIYPFSNAVEFFTGLRRLGKKAWMLVYSEGNHSLGGREALDFSIKMEQFFDCYLKDGPLPIWMSGHPGQDEQITTGFGYDRAKTVEEQGILTSEARKETDSLMNIKPRIIRLK